MGTHSVKHANAQAWLQQAQDRLVALICAAAGDHGLSLYIHAMVDAQVSVGFPYNSKRATGQCWHPAYTGRVQRFTIFISPELVGDKRRVVECLGTLAHELCHAAVGTWHNHNPHFGKLARALGLVGPLNKTDVGRRLRPRIEELARRLGPCPWAPMQKKRRLHMHRSTAATRRENAKRRARRHA